jgi:hypothetical protein
VSDLGAYKEEKGSEEKNDQYINDRNGAGASLGPLLHPGDGGIHQVSEEDRKHESNEGAAGEVEETQADREQRGREQNARRAAVNE